MIDPASVVARTKASNEMVNLIKRRKIHEAIVWELLLQSVLYAVETTCELTAQRVFIQELAASLNRKGLLTNNDVQPFREWGYMFMRGFE